MNNNIQNWDNIYKNKGPGSFLNYPSEILVAAFFRYKSLINLDGKCLDYGFGSGNNSEFLIQNMKELYGVEISDSAITAVKDRLKDYENFDEKNFANTLPTTSDFFDLIVAWQVLCYNTKESFNQSVTKLINSLKSGGIFITSISTHTDVKVSASKEIDKNTFTIGDLFPHQSGCVMFSPSSKEEFLQFFEGYNLEILDYGYFENMSYTDPRKCLSEYYLIARKK
jgi:SAM-dependent methyltransferase